MLIHSMESNLFPVGLMLSLNILSGKSESNLFLETKLPSQLSSKMSKLVKTKVSFYFEFNDMANTTGSHEREMRVLKDI